MSTGATEDTGEKRLAAFRGSDQAADRGERPSDFSDSTKPLAPEPLTPRAQEPELPEADAAPPVFADNTRRAIAEKARAARAAKNPDGDTAPLDKFNIPQGMHVEGEDDDARHAAEEARLAEADTGRQPPVRQPEADRQPAAADKSYNLRVNRNDISVTRDELLRYAEVDADEAKGMPEAALISLAQKQLAAKQRLEDARSASQSARTAGAEPAYPSDQLQPDAERNPPDAPTGLSARSDAELMEIIQFGSPEEASEAHNIKTARTWSMLNAEQRAGAFDREVRSAITDFAEKHPDIAKDADLADMHRGVLLREMSREITSKLPKLPGHIAARVATDQEFATKVYRAAIGDGHALRLPAQLFEDAARVVTSRFGKQDPAPEPSPSGGDLRPEPSARESRMDLKRGLFRQPGRSDHVTEQPSSQATGRRSPSETIRQRYGNRMNRG